MEQERGFSRNLYIIQMSKNPKLLVQIDAALRVLIYAARLQANLDSPYCEYGFAKIFLHPHHLYGTIPSNLCNYDPNYYAFFGNVGARIRALGRKYTPLRNKIKVITMANMLTRNKNLKPEKKSVDEHAEDALYREIWEEVHAQKTYDFVKKHMRMLIAGVIVIMIVMVGLQLYRHNRAATQIRQAQMFESALSVAGAKNYAAAEEAFARAASEQSGGMADLALFQSALLDVQSGKGDAKFQQLAADGATRDFRDLATLHIATMRGDSMTAAQFEKFLEPLQTQRSPFYYTSMLLIAQKYLAENNADAANKWLDKIINDKSAPATIAGMAGTLR